jgi:RHS repeat-associated protein
MAPDMFGDNTYIYNTHSATGEKLTTQFAIQAQPVLSPISGNGWMMETHPAAETEDVTGGLRSSPATPIDTDHRYYCGNMVYDGGERRLLTDEGYVTFSADGTPQYHFYLRDHLGNIRVVFGQTGTVEQVTHYYPFGGVMRESTNPGLQPYKYGGKELDRTSGIDAYDFGARTYFADRLQWGTMDPLCEKYYEWSPYNYCVNRPVNAFDSDGRDWYQDSDKTIQYSPNVHSRSDLKKNQLYIDPRYQNKQGTIFYRKDGSILFLNETEAYNRIWHQANVHYRNNGEKGGREVGGYILSDGKVLVMPDYLNDNSTSKFDIAGYILRGRYLIKEKESFIVVGQVHSHQDKSLPATPSFFTDNGYGDLGFSLENSSLPVFTLGHDGNIHGIRGYRNRRNEPIGLEVNLNSKDASRDNLLKGATSLYSIIKRLPIIRK